MVRRGWIWGAFPGRRGWRLEALQRASRGRGWGPSRRWRVVEVGGPPWAEPRARGRPGGLGGSTLGKESHRGPPLVSFLASSGGGVLRWNGGRGGAIRWRGRRRCAIRWRGSRGCMLQRGRGGVFLTGIQAGGAVSSSSRGAWGRPGGGGSVRGGREAAVERRRRPRAGQRWRRGSGGAGSGARGDGLHGSRIGDRGTRSWESRWVGAGSVGSCSFFNRRCLGWDRYGMRRSL